MAGVAEALSAAEERVTGGCAGLGVRAWGRGRSLRSRSSAQGLNCSEGRDPLPAHVLQVTVTWAMPRKIQVRKHGSGLLIIFFFLIVPRVMFGTFP